MANSTTGANSNFMSLAVEAHSKEYSAFSAHRAQNDSGRLSIASHKEGPPGVLNMLDVLSQVYAMLT